MAAAAPVTLGADASAPAEMGEQRLSLSAASPRYLFPRAASPLPRCDEVGRRTFSPDSCQKPAMVTVARPDGKDTPPPYTRSLKLLPWAYCSFSPPRPRRTLGRCRRDGRTQGCCLGLCRCEKQKGPGLRFCAFVTGQSTIQFCPLCQKPTQGQLSYTWNHNKV